MHIKKSKKSDTKKQQSHHCESTNRFTNLLMNRGKKSRAFQLFLKSITEYKKISFDSPLLSEKDHTSSRKICNKILNLVKPSVETRKVRIGGTVYQVPSITPVRRQEGLAMRWIIKSARQKKQTSNRLLSKSLGQEFFDTASVESPSIQKRDQVHILAANNRAYTRYRWW